MPGSTKSGACRKKEGQLLWYTRERLVCSQGADEPKSGSARPVALNSRCWKIFIGHSGSRHPGQRPGTGGDGLYLQAAQTELWEAVRRGKEMPETDCTEAGLAEKSKPAAGEEIRERQIGNLQ